MKTKALTVFLLLSAMYFPVNAQQPISWDMLKDVRWSQKYVASLSGYYQMPDFGKKIEDMDDTPVVIQGFYMPVDVDGTVFALSETPSTMCFFCGVGGIESVMEIFVKQGHKNLNRVRTDRYIQVKGTFKINRDDPAHLMYLLKDAELVKVIR